MKQVLSIADFVVIIELLNDKIYSYESYICRKFGEKNENHWEIIPAKLMDKQVQDYLSLDNYYQSLMRLKKSLENLNIEIETPSIEIDEEK